MKPQHSSAFLAGFVFALGLGISGMTNPLKVIGFLNLGSAWDPSLALVMLGAVLVYGIGFRWVMKTKKPLFAPEFQVPKSKKITPQLIVGSGLFGIGWGLGGFCPGPGLTALVSGQGAPIIFVVFMMIGMALFELFNSSSKLRKESKRD